MPSLGKLILPSNTCRCSLALYQLEKNFQSNCVFNLFVILAFQNLYHLQMELVRSECVKSSKQKPAQRRKKVVMTHVFFKNSFPQPAESFDTLGSRLSSNKDEIQISRFVLTQIYPRITQRRIRVFINSQCTRQEDFLKMPDCPKMPHLKNKFSCAPDIQIHLDARHPNNVLSCKNSHNLFSKFTKILRKGYFSLSRDKNN